MLQLRTLTSMHLLTSRKVVVQNLQVVVAPSSITYSWFLGTASTCAEVARTTQHSSKDSQQAAFSTTVPAPIALLFKNDQNVVPQLKQKLSSNFCPH